MSEKILLESNKYDAQILHDTDDGKLHVENLFDCSPAVVAAKEARDAERNMKSSFKHIAEVPMWLVHLSIKEGWYHDKKKWRQIIDEHSKFKVHKD